MTYFTHSYAGSHHGDVRGTADSPEIARIAELVEDDLIVLIKRWAAMERLRNDRQGQPPLRRAVM
jgi:hypothetical protein